MAAIAARGMVVPGTMGSSSAEISRTGRRMRSKKVADEQRAQWVAQAVGRFQRGKKALDRGQEELMHALQLAAKSDFGKVGKQLSSLKRRTRELEERLDRLLKR